MAQCSYVLMYVMLCKLVHNRMNTGTAPYDNDDDDDDDTPPSFATLSDDIQLMIASFHLPLDLLNVACVSNQFRGLNVDRIWKERCSERWKEWPRYRMSSSRISYLESKLPNTCWKQRFLWVEKDVVRTTLDQEEFESLGWYFNFTPSAGGRGDETLTRCIFRNGLLHLARLEYPPMPYRLDNVNSSQQRLIILPFPSHNIQRIDEDKEWLITNENVTFVSCGDEGELRFKMRGFRQNISFMHIREVPF
mmetsp:Transcript_4049/g.8587  ORF Transcript_4049/g.8587 Transcript_4049/m.8587 type:complete len:249 (-) Transcript_4049:2019-2765(-)